MPRVVIGVSGAQRLSTNMIRLNRIRANTDALECVRVGTYKYVIMLHRYSK